MRKLTTALAVLLLTACTTTPPNPIPLGAEVAPPYGCVELRRRGGDC
ncbi:hypothetical protein [uncultured Amphritea sp.]|nr:hypothetical protein [uncultured Amphritea sp.]